MCDFGAVSGPVIAAIITATVTIATTAVTYMAQQQQANAQAENQKKQMQAQDAAIAENAALANRSYMEQTKALQERQVQSDEAASLREFGVSRQAEQARATARTAAGEAGVSGLSVNALLNDFTRQEAEYRMATESNTGYEHVQTAAEIEAAREQAQGRTSSMQPYFPKPVNYPSFLGAGLRIAGDVYSAGKGFIPQNNYGSLTSRFDSASAAAAAGQGS